MLVLSRRRNDGITIRVGDTEVHIQVVNLTDRRVKLGIEAPQGAVIVRDELLSRTDTDRRSVGA